MIPLLSEDFAAFHIENFLTMTDVYCGLYDEEYTTEAAKNPIRVKWAFAAQFCNDLSKKHNLEPCYYLNGEPVSAINFDITGKDFECRYENNGWRLPTKDEARLPIFELYGDMIQREGWEWTNDDGEWLTGESKIIVHASDDSDLEKGICKLEETNSDPEEKRGFRLCRGIKDAQFAGGYSPIVNKKLTQEDEEIYGRKMHR